jgi:hypothetical protein
VEDSGILSDWIRLASNSNTGALTLVGRFTAVLPPH